MNAPWRNKASLMQRSDTRRLAFIDYQQPRRADRANVARAQRRGNKAFFDTRSPSIGPSQRGVASERLIVTFRKENGRQSPSWLWLSTGRSTGVVRGLHRAMLVTDAQPKVPALRRLSKAQPRSCHSPRLT